jgi:N-acetylneuraminic acid mutarotase
VRALAVYFPDDNDVYVLGGRTDDSSGSDVLSPYRYEPGADTWTQMNATFADPAVDNMVGGVLEAFGTRTIFTVGGSAAASVTAVDTVRQYNPATDSISEVSSDPWPGAGTDTLPGGAAVVDNRLYVFGGFKINTNMTNEIWEFDPARAATQRWKQMKSVVPSAEGYIPTAVANGYVYLLGGANFISNTITETTNVYRFDPRADTIVTLAQLPRAIAETQAVTQHDGSIWVFSGGRDTNIGNPAAVVNVYHPGTDTWTVGPPIAAGRRNAAITGNPFSGQIWAVGGYEILSNSPTPVALHEALVCPLLVDGFERGSPVNWTAVVP